MTIKFHNPPTVSLAGKYSLGAEVAPGARLVYVSGQVGLDSKGKLAPASTSRSSSPGRTSARS